MSLSPHTSLAKLVTKATGFELSPAQHAIVHIGTGRPLAELEGDVYDAAVNALGHDVDPEAWANILFLNCGARSGKTMFASYLATWRALVCDLSGMAPGEAARVAFISASKAQARAGLRYAKGLIRALGLGRLILSERRDAFVIDRGGHGVEFVVVRGNTGGDQLAGFWYPSLVVHECAIAVDPSANGVALDLDAVEKAVRPRLLPARNGRPPGLIIEETTSNDAVGPAYERFQSNHGKPGARLTVLRATTIEMRPDDTALHDAIESEREADPINAAREYGCEWVAADGSTGYLFGEDEFGFCLTEGMPLNLEPNPALQSWAGLDLGFTADGSALSIVRRTAAGSFELCALQRWRPKRKTPLRPSVVIGEALDIMHAHGCRAVWCDNHHFAQVSELAAERRGVRVKKAPAGAVGKFHVHRDAQSMMTSGLFRMGTDYQLQKSLRNIHVSKAPDGAVKIRSPRTRGNHGDDAASAVLAMWAAYKFGGRPTDALPKVGRPTEAARILGLVDANGRPRDVGDFRISDNGRGVDRDSYNPNRFSDRATFRSGGF